MPDDPVHRGADFVAHIGQELTLSQIGGLGGFFGLLNQLLGPFALFDIGASAEPFLNLTVRTT